MNFPDLFDVFASRVLPPDVADSVFLQLRHEAFAADLAPGSRLTLDTGRAHFAFIGSGATKLSTFASCGREQIVAFDYAGDMVYLPRKARSDFALTALVQSEILAIPADSLLHSTPPCFALLQLATSQTVEALGRSRENSLILGRKSAQERVAAFLLDLWELHAGHHTEGACAGDEDTIDLPMSRSEIADSLGLTIETVSRQFGELRDLGVIETAGRSILRVLDPTGLAHLTGQLAEAA